MSTLHAIITNARWPFYFPIFWIKWGTIIIVHVHLLIYGTQFRISVIKEYSIPLYKCYLRCYLMVIVTDNNANCVILSELTLMRPCLWYRD